MKENGRTRQAYFSEFKKENCLPAAAAYRPRDPSSAMSGTAVGGGARAAVRHGEWRSSFSSKICTIEDLYQCLFLLSMFNLEIAIYK